jgi:hypothetical protein
VRTLVSVLTFWIWLPLLVAAEVADLVGWRRAYFNLAYAGWWLSGLP